MSRTQTGKVELDAQRRELLARIGRVRRRLDRRAAKIQDRALLFGLLRMTESRSRGLSLLATVAVGAALSGFFSRRVSPAGGNSLLSFWEDVLRLFSHFRPRAAATETSRAREAATAGDRAETDETNDD